MSIFSRLFTHTPSPDPLPVNYASKDIINDVIRQYVTPAMKELGFHKHDRTFYKSHGELIYIVNIQANKWNSNGGAGFFVNVGVFHPRTFELEEGNPAPEYPKEYHAQKRDRFEHAAPKGKLPDEWSFNTYQDIEVVGERLAQALRIYIPSYFEPINNLQDLHDDLLQPGIAGFDKKNVAWLTVAIMTALLGDTTTARNYFERYHKNTSSRLTVVDRITKQLNIN